MLRLRQLIRSQARPQSLRTISRQAVTASPTIRHVRFRRPWLRSIVSKSLLYGAAFYLWSSFVLIRFDDETHDPDPSLEPSPGPTGPSQGPREGDLWTEGEGEDTAPLFFPLTWSRLQEGELYTASDPEWQEFVQISKDRKKLQKLRDELAAIVLESASGQLSQLLGSPLSLTGFWLVHHFPPRAPPGYLRSGMEIKDDSISWVTKPMDPDIGDRLQTFMKPVQVALAIKDAYLVLFRRQLDRLRGQPLDAGELLHEKYLLPSQERLNSLSSREQPRMQPPVSDEVPENLVSDRQTNLHPSSIISSLQRLPLPDLGPGSDLHLASIAFRLRLNEYRARNPRTPLRGTFFISGPVGLKGPHGFCRFEVRGEYDPAKPGWRTVEMKVKDINFRKQRPLGGR